MPRKKIIPKVKYVQTEKPDQKAIDVVFGYLFEKVLAQEVAKKNK